MKPCLFCGELKKFKSDYCATHTVECEDCGEKFELSRAKLKRKLFACTPCARERHSRRMKKYTAEGLVGFGVASNQAAAKEAVEKKYGVKNVSQVPAIRAKIEKTMLERYGSASPFGSEEVQKKIAKINLEKYGSENPFGADKIKEKIKATNVERYGATSHMKNPEMRAKQAATMLERHGFTSPLQSFSIHEAQKATMLERYGVTNPAQLDHVRKASRESLTLMTDDDFKAIVLSLASSKDSGRVAPEEIRASTPYANRGHIYKKIRELNLEEFVDYSGESQVNVYWRLLIERELGVTLKTEGSIFPDKRWKCDLYSEEHKIGIDINPTISHSTQKAHPIFLPKTTAYHRSRALEAQAAGWLLYQIYDWDKEAAVISQLRNLFGLNEERYYARKCVVEQIEKRAAVDFLEAHHRQGGSAVGSVFYGLSYEGELVQVMTFSRGRFKNALAEWELLRLASRGTVAGGASKLFSAFLREHSPKNVLSYSNLDTGRGKVYEMLGFRFSGLTGLNALYSKPDTSEAFKVTTCSKKFGGEYRALGQTQQEFMNAKGFFRINDAGSKIFLWEAGYHSVKEEMTRG